MTNIPTNELSTQLKNLFNPGKTKKQMVLKKEYMKTPKIEPGENVCVFDGYKNPSLKVNLIPKKTHKKKTVNEKSAVQGQVEQEIKIERQHVLDAIIVRIMKARKQWQHNPLMQEVMKQVNLFKP